MARVWVRFMDSTRVFRARASTRDRASAMVRVSVRSMARFWIMSKVRSRSQGYC